MTPVTMPSEITERPKVPQQPLRRPRLGFAGVGWIGANRLQAVVASGAADVVALADPSHHCRENAIAAAGLSELQRVSSEFQDLLDLDLDGIVIATPSAYHADQTLAALRQGMAVFCQKPLARTVEETRTIIEAAQRADCLLGVDLSYRYVNGVREMRELVQSGALGRVFAADLVFDNAYGPDKPWFYDIRQSGGGCLIDLGTHLIDLAQWVLDSHGAFHIRSQLFQQGVPLRRPEVVEDFAEVNWVTDSGTAVHVRCSWKLHAGCDAAIGAAFYGSEGAVRLRNVEGSFYDFIVEHMTGTSRKVLASPPDTWGGRCIQDWVARLAQGNRFDPATEALIDVAGIIDWSYGR